MAAIRRPSTKLRTGLGFLAPLAAGARSGCGINAVPTEEEKVNAAWGNLQADNQRRADLIPNLLATVKGYANQEKTVLIEVTQARAGANSVKLSGEDLSDPAKMKAFDDAQNRITLSLQRLQEAYPVLKSIAYLLALQDQHKGTEYRIKASRRVFISAVQE